MKLLPDWFKIVWWVLLLLGLSYFLSRRYDDVVGGKSNSFDLFTLLVWTTLVLLPLFQEISFFGMTFKREVEALKASVKEDFASLRAEIRNSVDVRTQINPSFSILAPPLDSQLPDIEKRVQAAIDAATQSLGLQGKTVSTDQLTVPENAVILFRVRHNIERELRRLWAQRTEGGHQRRFVPTLQIARSLADVGLIDRGIEGAIREVWLVASPAIHGEDVTSAQVDFVRDVAPRLVETLKAIR